MNSPDRGTAADQPRKRRRLPFRKRSLLVLGSLLAMGAMLTSAGFVDTEYAQAEGIHTSIYDLRLSRTGEEGSYTSTSPVAPLPPTGTLKPGVGAASATIWVKNYGGYYSSLNVRLVTTSTAAAAVALLNAMRYEVKVGGVTVASNAQDGLWTWPQISVPASNPEATGGIRLPDLDPGEDVEVEIIATVPADADLATGTPSATIYAVFIGETIPADAAS